MQSPFEGIRINNLCHRYYEHLAPQVRGAVPRLLANERPRPPRLEIDLRDQVLRQFSHAGRSLSVEWQHWWPSYVAFTEFIDNFKTLFSDHVPLVASAVEADTFYRWRKSCHCPAAYCDDDCPSTYTNPLGFQVTAEAAFVRHFALDGEQVDCSPPAVQGASRLTPGSRIIGLNRAGGRRAA